MKLIASTFALLTISCLLPHPITPTAFGEEPSTLWDFEADTENAPPAGWKADCSARTVTQGFWAVTQTSPNQKILALINPNHTSSGAFNLCWTDDVAFRNGEIKLRFKADSGRIDQGGGPIWRVMDKNNYYNCRANPLENNFRLYTVKNGSRHQIASANVLIKSGKWHTIRILHHNNRIECYFNGERLITHEDNTFTTAGGVGVWTKADALTSFDDIEVHPTP